MKYQTKPVEIEAVQFTGFDGNPYTLPTDLYEFIKDAQYHCRTGKLVIVTLEGEMTTDVGDYIIKGVKGEFYPCKPDAFEWKYEPVDESEEGRMKRHFQAWGRALRESVRIKEPINKELTA